MKKALSFYPYSQPKFSPVEWLLALLFPILPPVPFHPINELQGVLGYQRRLDRTGGVEMTGYITQTRIKPRVTETGVKYSVEGEYVELGRPVMGDLRFPERSRKVAIYPVRVEEVPEPTVKQISTESLEELLNA
jgi:hypothetical protein